MLCVCMYDENVVISWWVCLTFSVIWEAMLQSGNWLVARRLVATIIYKLVRFVFITVQHIYWQLNGTAQKLCEARLPHNYDWSAQVLDIVLCYKFCPGLLTTVDDFLCTHSCFENPQFIIDNDNITLLTVTDHDAIFCEAKEKGSKCKWQNTHLLYGKFG